MIPWRFVYAALSETLFQLLPEYPEEFIGFVIAFEFDADLKGSADPAVFIEFGEDAPERFASTAEALRYCARFLRRDLVKHWHFDRGLEIVDALEKLAEGKSDGVSPALVDLAHRLDEIK